MSCKNCEQYLYKMPCGCMVEKAEREAELKYTEPIYFISMPFFLRG